MSETPVTLSTARAARAGMAGVAPTLAMVLPFGVVSGAISAEAGLDFAQTMALSALVFAGASQLATIELLRAGAPILVIIATGMAVNLRFTMYAAALAPWLRGGRLWPKIGASALLVDNTFGVAMAWFRKHRDYGPGPRLVYLVAGGALVWLGWQSATLVGFAMGAALPPELSLDFVAPIAFLGLAMPLLRDSPSWLAAAVASAVAVAFKDLPFNAGVIAASLAGIAAALLAEHALKRRNETEEPRVMVEQDHG